MHQMSAFEREGTENYYIQAPGPDPFPLSEKCLVRSHWWSCNTKSQPIKYYSLTWDVANGSGDKSLNYILSLLLYYTFIPLEMFSHNSQTIHWNIKLTWHICLVHYCFIQKLSKALLLLFVQHASSTTPSVEDKNHLNLCYIQPLSGSGAILRRVRLFAICQNKSLIVLIQIK